MIPGRLTTLVALSALLLLGGCGSDTQTFSSPDSPSASPTSASASASATSEADADFDHAATFTASDNGGDEGSFDLLFGESAPASDVDVPAVQACSSRVSDLDRAVAVPVRVTGRLSSSLSTDVTVDLTNVDEIDEGQLLTATSYLWAASYSDAGAVCENSGDYESGLGTVHWNDMSSGSPKRFTTWLVIEDAVTPDDPTGQARIGSIAFGVPHVSLGGKQTTGEWVEGVDLVTCLAPDIAAGGISVAAVDLAAAYDAGCT